SSTLSSPVSNPEAFISTKEEAEGRLDKYSPQAKDDEAASFLKVVIKYLPKRGAMALMRDILSLTDADLPQLRLHLIECLLLPMRALGGKTPAYLTPSPISDAQDQADHVMVEIEPSSREGQRRLRAECLRRDGWCCVVTRAMDWSHATAAELGIHRVTAVQCAHILPLSLSNFDDKRELEVYNHSVIWSALYRYFPEIEPVVASGITNSPCNTITLDPTLHLVFGSFRLAFEAKKSPGRYRIVYYGSRDYSWPDEATIDSQDSSVPAPSPVLLRTHAAIAKILHVSGLAKKLDELLDPPQIHSQISPNGSTDIGLILSQRLLKLDY
ncbi:hypothetical protein V8E54_009252, partial [Elaphomyces granulatus]